MPRNGRIIFMPPAIHVALRFDKRYTGTGDTSAQIAKDGAAEFIDGMEIIVVPSDYLPEHTVCMITHPCAMCSPVKLAEYNVHEDPPGVSGWLVEGRTYYDALVLNNKKSAIALLRDDSATEDAE